MLCFSAARGIHVQWGSTSQITIFSHDLTDNSFNVYGTAVRLHIKIKPKSVLIALLSIIALLFFANGMGIFSKFYFHHGNVHGLVPLFDFDAEQNIPSYYSSFALLFSSVLLAFIAYGHKISGSKHYLSWFGLSAIMLCLSIDELVSIHEPIGKYIREEFHITGFLYHAWVIPYGILLLIFLTIYTPFLMRLQKKIMMMFVLSGIIYVSGAMGFEMVDGYFNDFNGEQSLVYAFMTTGEELFEMLGIAFFNYALLTYLSIEFDGIILNIESSGVREA